MEKDIKEFIDNNNNFSENEIDAICTTIMGLDNEEAKKELTNLFLEKMEKDLIENATKYPNSELEKRINHSINRLEANEITRSVLSERNFNIDNLSEQLVDDEELEIKEEINIEEKEIDKIQETINQLTNKELNIITDEKYINSNIEEIDKEINELISKRNSNWNFSLDNKLNINNLTINDKNKFINDISSINSKIKELENIKKAKNNKYYGISNEELNNKIHELNNDLNNTEYYSLKDELKKLEEEFMKNYLFPGLSEDELKAKEELKRKINNIKNKINEKDELNKKTIEELKNELKQLENPVNVLGSLTFGDKDKQNEYRNQKERIAFLKKVINEREKIEFIKNELNNINIELKDRDKNLTADEKNKLNNLQKITKAYYNIINDTIEKYNNKEIDNIEDFVNNHKDIDIINSYENSDKLKNELLEEIKNKLNISKNKDENNKITKKSNDKRKWLKAIQAVAGFATGLAFSCAPGVGIITMGLAGAKLGVSAINFLSKKNPEGKITKFIEKNKNKFTNIAENKFPGITEKANNMRNKIKDFYDKYEIKYFLNGMAAGYLTGNLVEIFTGETVLEHAKNLFNNNSGNISQVAPGKITPGNVTPENVPTTELLSTNISDFTGQNFDLSSVPQGFVSSYSDTPVNLITESAKNLSFDKANFVNGEEWWHFLKPDGQGYAWFKADDVRHLVEGAIKSGKSI